MVGQGFSGGWQTETSLSHWLFRCEERLPADENPQACRRGEPLARKAVENTIDAKLAVLIGNLENAPDLGTYVFVGGANVRPLVF